MQVAKQDICRFPVFGHSWLLDDIHAHTLYFFSNALFSDPSVLEKAELARLAKVSSRQVTILFSSSHCLVVQSKRVISTHNAQSALPAAVYTCIPRSSVSYARSRSVELRRALLLCRRPVANLQRCAHCARRKRKAGDNSFTFTTKQQRPSAASVTLPRAPITWIKATPPLHNLCHGYPS